MLWAIHYNILGFTTDFGGAVSNFQVGDPVYISNIIYRV